MHCGTVALSLVALSLVPLSHVVLSLAALSLVALSLGAILKIVVSPALVLKRFVCTITHISCFRLLSEDPWTKTKIMNAKQHACTGRQPH